MKTKEELNALKKEAETVNEKLQELTEEEIAQVTGGHEPPSKERSMPSRICVYRHCRCRLRRSPAA